MNLELTVEIVQFELIDGVEEIEFLQDADSMIPELKSQPGFIKRALLKSPDGQWMDIVHWNSLSEAQQAAENVLSLPNCLNYFRKLTGQV
jgi:heme-degrading monooxygenase HmoA